MSYGWMAFWLWLVALTQAYFISALSGTDFSINIALVVLLYIGMNRRPRLAILMAAWLGLWLDIAAGQLGPRLLALMLLTLTII